MSRASDPCSLSVIQIMHVGQVPECQGRWEEVPLGLEQAVGLEPLPVPWRFLGCPDSKTKVKEQALILQTSKLSTNVQTLQMRVWALDSARARFKLWFKQELWASYLFWVSFSLLVRWGLNRTHLKGVLWEFKVLTHLKQSTHSCESIIFGSVGLVCCSAFCGLFWKFFWKNQNKE